MTISVRLRQWGLRGGTAAVLVAALLTGAAGDVWASADTPKIVETVTQETAGPGHQADAALAPNQTDLAVRSQITYTVDAVVSREQNISRDRLLDAIPGSEPGAVSTDHHQPNDSRAPPAEDSV
jgi:hypothetical protein